LRALLKVKNKKKEGQGFGYNKKRVLLLSPQRKKGKAIR